MSAKKPHLSTSPEKKPRWISCELTEKQKADMSLRLADFSAVWDWVLKLIEGNYKVTLQYDTYNDCHACYVFPVGDEHTNAGHILSNRGSSPSAALRGAVYRHFAVFDEIWGHRDRSVIDDD